MIWAICLPNIECSAGTTERTFTGTLTQRFTIGTGVDMDEKHEIIYRDKNGIQHNVITTIRQLTEKGVRFREDCLVRFVPLKRVVTMKKVENAEPINK